MIMTKINHNKKRNIGILYELLVKHISSSLIEENQKNIKIATKIIEKHFEKNTEIFKEFRIFNCLYNSNIKSKENISILLNESKKAALKINYKKLEREKSMLIKEINYNIDRKFYQQHLSNYKLLGNIQLLINEWKKGDSSNLKNIVMFQEGIIDHLLKEKVAKNKTLLENKNSDEHKNNLVFSLMTKKINNKYKDFSSLQKNIIKSYALFNKNKDDSLKESLMYIKNQTLIELKNFIDESKNNIIEEKYEIVKNKINNLDFEVIDDKKIVKFLTITKLLEEIKQGE